MKIMFLTSGGDIGGAKTHILSLAGKLMSVHEVCLVSFRKGAFPESAKSVGIRTEIISNKTIFSDIAVLFRLFDSFKPDIVHCHGSKPNTMGAFLKIFKGAVTVTTLHSDYKKDYMNYPLKQLVFGGINAIALRFMDNYITVSDSLAESMILRKFNPLKMYSICNGLDFSDCDVRINRQEYAKGFGFDVGPDDIIIGFAARLTAIKDASTLLRGFAEAKKQCKNIKLIIAGEGDEKKQLEQLAKKLYISDDVCFLGWLSDMKSFFACADICALTSLSEGFPYSIVEGARQKCAIISSDVGGIHTLIKNEETGLMFEAGDYMSFASHIVRLVNDQQLRIKMGNAVFEKAKSEFSIERMAAMQSSIYLSIIEKRHAKNKKSDIIICGAYGKGNAGDDAIEFAIVNALKNKFPLSDIYIMTRRPMEARLVERAGSLYTFNVFKFLSTLSHSYLFINGGGSLIQDITSSRSLYYYLFTLFAAKKAKCSVMMYGCGIGPVNHSFNKSLAKACINRYVDCITLRDELSKKELESLGIFRPKIKMSADPAVNLPKATSSAINDCFKSEGIPANGKYLGILLRTWKQFDISSELAQTAEYAYKKYGLTAVFFQAEYLKDLQASKAAAEKLKTPYYIIKGRHSHQEITGMLSKMEAVISMRLHGLIFAVSQGIPAIGISYDIKVDGFMQYIKSPWYIKLSDITAEKLIKLIDSGVLNGEKASALGKDLKELEKENILSAEELINRHTHIN